MLTPAYAPTATERVLPRLALDFTTGVLDPRVTVARALNTATRINSSGLVEVVNADLPRFDYDPTTLAPKGLLIEETRINYIRYSEDFTQAVWQKLVFGAGVLPVVTPNYETAPNGLNTATRIQLNAGPNGSGDYSLLRQSSVGPGGTVSRSIWAKSNTGTNQVVAIVATTAATKVTITPTWQRIILPNSTAGAQQFDISVGGTGATPATADISIWGAQHEVGAFATSYIPNLAAGSTTRNADVVSMTGANFSSWYNTVAGTYVTEGATFGAAVTRAILGHPTLGFANYIRNTNAGAIFEQTNVVFSSNTITSGTVFKLATAYNASGMAAVLNAGARGTGPTNGNLALYDLVYIGSNGSGSFFNGHVRKINYYKQFLLEAEMQAFTK